MKLTREQVEAMLAEATKRADEIPQEVADRENSCSACCGAYGQETWDDYADHQDRLLLISLSKAARELLAAWDREAKLRDEIIAKCDKVCDDAAWYLQDPRDSSIRPEDRHAWRQCWVIRTAIRTALGDTP